MPVSKPNKALSSKMPGADDGRNCLCLSWQRKDPGEVGTLLGFLSPKILHHLKPKAAPLLPKGWDRSHGAPVPAETEEAELLQRHLHLLLAPD